MTIDDEDDASGARAGFLVTATPFVSYLGRRLSSDRNHDRHAEWLEIARTYCEKHDLDKRTHVRGLMRLLADEYSEGQEETSERFLEEWRL